MSDMPRALAQIRPVDPTAALLVNFGTPTITVAPEAWRAAASCCESAGFDFFEMLTVVDQLDRGFDVLLSLRDATTASLITVATTVARDQPSIASLVDVFAAADWYEREAYEMFGVDFVGHPNLAPILLHPQSPQFPLRKDEWLERRVTTPWPGVKEPGESVAAESAAGELEPSGSKSSESKSSESKSSESVPAAAAALNPARPKRRARPLGVPDADRQPRT